MIEAVSNSNVNNIRAMDKVSQEKLYSPGAYAIEKLLGPMPEVKEKKKSGGFLGFLGKIVFAAGVVCLGAVALRRYLPSMQNLEINAYQGTALQGFKKLKYDFKYNTSKLADWIVENTMELVNKVKDIKFKKETSVE